MGMSSKASCLGLALVPKALDAFCCRSMTSYTDQLQRRVKKKVIREWHLHAIAIFD
jgi:hypothetical protein